MAACDIVALLGPVGGSSTSGSICGKVPVYPNVVLLHALGVWEIVCLPDPLWLCLLKETERPLVAFSAEDPPSWDVGCNLNCFVKPAPSSLQYLVQHYSQAPLVYGNARVLCHHDS